MPDIDLEAEYNNRARVPEHVEIQGRWEKASAIWRKEAIAELDQAYGTGARRRYDLFWPTAGDRSAPLAVYIHGGYWQRGDRLSAAFLARELNRQGVAVAVPSYTLCPETTVPAIIGELRQFMKSIWEATRQHPVVVGHSAGGHLAAAMVATDWSQIAGLPPDLARAGYALSGVFDLAPLVPTSLNGALKLTAATAREASPILWPAPPKDRTFVAAVGADESREFIRQGLELAASWSRAGVKAECVVIPDVNHFTIVDRLADADSAMLARIVGLARMCATPAKGA